MSAEAVVMMVVAMVLLWGGLAAAIVNLRRGRAPEAGEVRRDL